MKQFLASLRSMPRLAISAFKRDTAAFASRHVYFGLVAFFGFPAYYFIWHDLFPQSYENLELRLAGSVIFLPIIFAKYWPNALKPWLPLYWYLALVFALPFFFTFMLLKSDASTIWLLSSLAALLVMILLLDPLNLLIHIVVGIASAVIVFDITTGLSALATLAALEFIPVYLFALSMGIIVSYSGEKLRHERQQAMAATVGMIAHELRTPLLSIKAGASGMRQHLPSLLHGYQRATEMELVQPTIRPLQMESMSGVLDRIEAEADRSNTVIDMLLYTARGGRIGNEEFHACSMTTCIDTALRRYPFSSENDRGLVQWERTSDFSFTGTETLMVHVIFNLMKNAIRHIHVAGKGRISLAISSDPLAHRFVFSDTGPGIPADVLPHIFRRYYSWPPHGRGVVETTGLGLSFCREVITSFGGTILCNSRPDNYTEFVIAFPRGAT